MSFKSLLDKGFLVVLKKKIRIKREQVKLLTEEEIKPGVFNLLVVIRLD